MLVDPLTMKPCCLPPKSSLYVVKKWSYEKKHSLMAAILNLVFQKNIYINAMRTSFWQGTYIIYNQNQACT